MRAAAALAGVVVMLCSPVVAAGQTAGSAPKDPNAPDRVLDLEKPPPLHQRKGSEIERIAAGVPKVRRARGQHRGSYPVVYTKGPGHWQVSYWVPGRDAKEIAQVYVDDATGGVTEAWTGHQVAWTMARGYDGAFGRKVNSPIVWLALTALFLVPFLRLPLRLFHLDLAALAAFGISLAYFNEARIGVSVPLVYPLLAYLLGRMLWLALRRDEDRRDELPLLVPVRWLGLGVVFLLGFRLGLNLTNSNVIDVGYAGVIGADRLAGGEELYGGFPKDNERGDTYGPVTYAAYVPFEKVFPWGGTWDDLPAAHAAAVAFDALCCGLLYLIGRRTWGRGAGMVLAYLWVAFPFTLYVANTNSNDALPAALVLGALLAAASPVRRGALTALAGLSKFGPLALAPVLATHGWEPGRRVRTVVLFTAGFAVAAAFALSALLLTGDSLREFYDRTLGFQASRGSPFSIWGLYGLDIVQVVWQAAAVLLAVALALVPRRRDIAGLAAACAAVLIALQAGVTHWFYLYIVWFFPLCALALVGSFRVPDPQRA